MALKSSVERAEKKAGGFASAKKNVVIQYQGRERQEQHLLDLIKDEVLSQGMKDDEINRVDVYVKPEEGKVFYVVNQEINGEIAF
ncbi:MAG: hypothetical protein J5972_02455 [Eubacterium sp.]|nr:hypothetical protein [Eubacterium sp.]